MARDGLSALLSLCVALVALAPTGAAPPGDDPRARLAATLAVQAALRQGRDHLLRGEHEAAIRVLESQVARIDGSREYLAALRDAYRGHVKDLQLSGRAAEARVYVRRLAILDPAAAREFGFSPPTGGKTPPPAATAKRPAVTPRPRPKGTAELPPEPRPGRAAAGSPLEGMKARGKPYELTERTPPAPAAPEIRYDPFAEGNHVRIGEARSLLARAEEEFRAGRYDRAGELYDQAHAAVPGVARGAAERWAYCRLHRVVRRLNQRDNPPGADELRRLESEVRDSVGMTPKLRGFGDKLLASIAGRRDPEPAAGERPPQPAEETTPPAVPVRHSRPEGSQWALAETTNFRIFHNQEEGYAEKVAQVAEAARAAAQRKWFGAAAPAWKPRCDVYLHANADAYARATGQPANLPGHSRMESEHGRIRARQVHLRLDAWNVVTETLPHETTHVVLADRFDLKRFPVWADEGMAALTEPPAKVRRYLADLPRFRQENLLFPVEQLLGLTSWPEGRAISAFYSQSVSLVDYLCRWKGERAFVAFVRDGMSGGFEAALRKHYGIKGYADLERRWQAHAFDGGADRGIRTGRRMR